MISICIPTYERTNLLWESVHHVYNDPRVSEIVIVDDCSSPYVFNEIVEHYGHECVGYNENEKVRIYRNEKNLDCYRNKREAVSKAKNDIVILLDSDNVITPAYLDALYRVNGDLGPWGGGYYPEKILYQPSFAKPHFDFRQFQNLQIDHSNVSAYMVQPSFQTMLNAMNFVVNRDEFLRVWDGSVDPVTSDSIYFNYKWLEAGNSIYVVLGMHYEHRVHDCSHYKNNNRRTPKGFHEDIVQRLKNMR